MSEFIDPRSYFSDCEMAIETVCWNCPYENGWALDYGDGDVCQGMIDIQDARQDIILKDGDKFACAMRIKREKEDGAELVDSSRAERTCTNLQREQWGVEYDDDDGFQCSECGYDDDQNSEPKYCPNCGAKVMNK